MTCCGLRGLCQIPLVIIQQLIAHVHVEFYVICLHLFSDKDGSFLYKRRSLGTSGKAAPGMKSPAASMSEKTNNFNLRISLTFT